ncbi:MAG TPA: peptidoglycan DD-metalloendopeptidase family protein [Cellvibrio sp.]|nr:peptidoglycan DD-metalloendopeptidase family protein [Cellvibrio sp.]
MLIRSYTSSDILLRVVSILIIFCLVSSCASNRGAEVDERSGRLTPKGKVHTVSAGETLFSIAWRYGVDLKKLAEFNAIKSPYTIYPSQKVRVDLRAGNGQNTNTGNTKSTVKNSHGKGGVSGSSRSEKGSTASSKSKGSAGLQSAPKWHWPSAGKLIALFQGETGLNKGIDLSGKLGEPVLAAASGRVVYAGSGLSGYGKLLIIKHNETFLSAYAHNDEISVKEGDFVKAGQRIADMGSSGTDRVKLHFEIRSEGSPVDPLKFLPKR